METGKAQSAILIRSDLLRRFIQFGLVGGSGVLVDMGVLFIMCDSRVLGCSLILSKIVAAEAAILNNFIWNDFWTFRDLARNQPGWRGYVSRFGKFNLICLTGVGLNVLLLKAQVNFLHLNVYVANFIAIGSVCVWNFWMNLKFGWRKNPA